MGRSHSGGKALRVHPCVCVRMYEYVCVCGCGLLVRNKRRPVWHHYIITSSLFDEIEGEVRLRTHTFYLRVVDGRNSLLLCRPYRDVGGLFVLSPTGTPGLKYSGPSGASGHDTQ